MSIRSDLWGRLRSCGIAAVCFLATTCSSGGSGALDEPPQAKDSVLFTEVTSTHLPSVDARGFSMDARLADLNQDGHLDLIIANEFRPNLLWLNLGQGQFVNVSATHIPQTNRDSEDIGIGDFDLDGDVDIIIVSEDDQINELYLNDGSGRFTDASDRLPVTGISNAVLVVDIDLDLDPDILIGNNGQNVVLINDGTGQFSDATAQRLPLIADVTQDLELGDIDGDGDLDLLVGNEDVNRLLLNTGLGVFVDVSTERLPLRSSLEETREADFGDVDGDGDLDILFANVQLFVPGATPQNRLLLNDGGGFYVDATAQRLPADRDQSMDGDFIDLDADGHLDIVTANLASVRGSPANAPYRVYVNDGHGVFTDDTARFFSPTIVGNGLDIEAADVDQDGWIDLFLASRGGPDRLLLNQTPF